MLATECTQSNFEFAGIWSRSVVARFDGGKITSNGGGLLLQQVDQRIGLLSRLSGCFLDARDQRRVRHGVREMLAQRVYGLALGYEDLNDHEQLREDPLLMLLAGSAQPDKPLAGKSTLNRLELGAELAAEDRYKKVHYDAAGIDELLVQIFLEAHREAPQEIVIDLDATDLWWDAGDYMKYVETISYTVALQELGVRDFPNQMGAAAPLRPPAPPLAISYAGSAAGSPASADFSSEANFGLRFLLRMWDDKSRTLFYQVGNSQDWNNVNYLSDYDIWRLPEADDDWNGCSADARFICNRPAFVSGPPGSKISPNLAGRLTADFAVCYQLNRETYPALANRCLKNAEDIFELADTSLADPAASVDSGTCKSGCLLTIVPFDGYPETVWDDDMELGATELYLALRLASQQGDLPAGLPRNAPEFYLAQAAHYARSYIDKIYKPGLSDTLNLYDVSGLAHFELWRALGLEAESSRFASLRTTVRRQLLTQVNDSLALGAKDPWGFGGSWSSDTTSHGAGLSVMASEAYYLTGIPIYNVASQRWMANILGANAWGSSFIVGAGSSTFPNCIQHQVANLAGALDGTRGGSPILWGAATEGPSGAATTGLLDGMLTCPADGSDQFARFNGNGAVYQDNVQSYSTTEPAIDLTATSFLMWSWRLAHGPAEQFFVPNY